MNKNSKKKYDAINRAILYKYYPGGPERILAQYNKIRDYKAWYQMRYQSALYRNSIIARYNLYKSGHKQLYLNIRYNALGF